MSSATGLPPLDNTMGALFLGVVLSMALWGAGCVQMYYYYNRYLKDDLWIKTLVFVVWALDTVHQGLITQCCYVYLVTEYGNPVYLNTIVPTLLTMVLFTAFICFLVQCFFLLRVWRLSHKNIFITGILLGLVLAQCIATIVYYGKAFRFKTFTELQKVYPISRTINVVSAVADACIAGSVIFFLQRSRTGFSKSESIINRLILFSVNTGLLTGLCAIASLVTNVALPLTFVYIMFYLMVSRLYTNSLYASLNARKSLRGGHVDESTDAAASSLSMGRLRSRPIEIDAPTYGQGNPRMLSIKVDTETTRARDDKSVLPEGAPSDSDVESNFPPSSTKDKI